MTAKRTTRRENQPGTSTPSPARDIHLTPTWLALLLTLIMWPGSSVHAQSNGGSIQEEEIQFQSGGVTLSGTILVPDGAGPLPAIVLVHGAGLGEREQYRLEAEAFAQRGIVTLIYDKRTVGYSQFKRSYALLADDALAAVRTLRDHPKVNERIVGLWGVSEGAWVVPLAASRSDAVAFVTLVAATGVPPAQQHSWYLENQLRHQGVTGSMVRAIARTGTRLTVDAGMLAEANHDPVPPLEQLRQPVLALWGDKDRIEPPAESAQIVREALERGGNTRYTIRFFEDAEHGLRFSPNGFVIGEDLVSGYPETVAEWVHALARGEVSGPVIDGSAPLQDRPSQPLSPLAWWESSWMQLAALTLMLVAFLGHLTGAAVQSIKRRRRHHAAVDQEPSSPALSWARRLAAAGLLAVLGFLGYFSVLMFTGATMVGPVIAGRSIVWLALQALAVATTLLTLLVIITWWPRRTTLTRAEASAISITTIGGLVFIAWAENWGLLLP